MWIGVFKGEQEVWCGDSRCVTRNEDGAITIRTTEGKVIIAPATAREIARVLHGGAPDDLDDPETWPDNSAMEEFLLRSGWKKRE